MAKERIFQAIRIYKTGYDHILPSGLPFVAKNKKAALKKAKANNHFQGCKIAVWEKTNA